MGTNFPSGNDTLARIRLGRCFDPGFATRSVIGRLLNADPLYNFGCHASLCYSVLMKVREVIRAIEADGWQQVRTPGSHRQFNHASKQCRDSAR
jgi:hypothetical protein